MKVNCITVEAHEKRNNPNAYGHYDARVAYNVELEEGDDPDEVVACLQTKASAKVIGECDRWENEIQLENQRESARIDLNRLVRNAKTSPLFDDRMMQFETSLALLSRKEQDDYRAKLQLATAEYLVYLRKEQEGHISAAQKGLLSEGGKIRFDQDLQLLPEEERGDYQTRMDATWKGREKAQSLAGDDDSDVGSDPIPF